MSEKIGKELNLAFGLVGLEFVFITLMMDIPRDDVLYNQTKSFYLPLYYAISLPNFIQSCILISFLLLVFSILIYLGSYSIKNDPQGTKKIKSHKLARCFLYIGSYYWILLFISALIIYNIKFQTIADNLQISGIYFMFVIFVNMIIQYFLFETLLPKSYNFEPFRKIIPNLTFKQIIFLAHLIFWGIMWIDIVKYAIPKFYYFTPIHLQFSSSLILILIMLIIDQSFNKNRYNKPKYIV